MEAFGRYGKWHVWNQFSSNFWHLNKLLLKHVFLLDVLV
jgi:hypothetical protein